MKKILTNIGFLFLISLLFAGGSPETSQSKEMPTKIVSLSPAATEILFAIGAGDRVIARTDFCNFPLEAESIPTLGGFDGKAFSLESIIALQPDFVYGTQGMHDHLKRPLESYGIQLYLSDAQTIESIYDEIISISHITGKNEAGEKLVLQMKKDIESLMGKIQNSQKKAVYWEVWHEPFMSVGATSYINDIIKTAGGENIFFDIASAYPVVSEETILVRNPQVILLPDDGAITKEDVKQRSGWQNVDAVIHDSLYYIDADITTRPGPRAAQAVEIIARTLYPHEVF